MPVIPGGGGLETADLPRAAQSIVKGASFVFSHHLRRRKEVLIVVDGVRRLIRLMEGQRGEA